MTLEIGQWIATCGANHGVGKVTDINPETGQITATFSPIYDPQNRIHEKKVDPSEIGEVMTDPGMIQECEQSIQ